MARPADLLEAARTHHRAGRYAEAEALYRQSLELAPDDVDALHLLGMLAFQTGRHAEAVARVRAALRLRDDDADMHHDLGNVLETMGDLHGAAASYGRALERAPGHADAHYNLAGVLRQQGRMEEAIASYRASIAASPGQADAHNNLGTLLQAQGHLDQAIAAFHEAVARDPSGPAYRHNLALGLVARANALYAAGRLQDAALGYHDAIGVLPDHAPAHNNLANVLDELGHPALALASYRKAVALDATPPVTLNLARALRAVRNPGDDLALRELTARALRVPWIRPAELAHAAGELLAEHPVVGPWIALGQAGDWDALADEPLFEALLTRAPVADWRLERFVGALRRDMLARAVGGVEAGSADVECAVARQCFINEYVIDETPGETADVERLAQRIDARGADVPAAWIAAYAAYRPLFTLRDADRLAALEAPPALRALVRQQVAEPREERALRDAMPSLTPVRGAASQRVQAQYEESPYPRWTDTPRPVPLAFDDWLGLQLPRAALPRRATDAPLQILVAGCGTGREAVEAAERHPDAQVLAIDLSRASLAYALRMTAARRVDNVTYAQADILELPAIGRTFDVVVAGGVLHHLADPLAGWDALVRCLAPGGVMRVGLYSALARRDIALARAFVADGGFAHSHEGIRAARAALRADGRFTRVTSLRDFHATSEARDLLFHVQEASFTLPQVREALDRLGLELLGFVLERSVLRAYREAHPDDPAAVDLAGWDAFERAQPDTFLGMYEFWARRRI